MLAFFRQQWLGSLLLLALVAGLALLRAPAGRALPAHPRYQPASPAAMRPAPLAESAPVPAQLPPACREEAVAVTVIEEADAPLPAPPEDRVRDLPEAAGFAPDRPRTVAQDAAPGSAPAAGDGQVPDGAEPPAEEPAGLGAVRADEPVPLPAAGVRRSERTLFLSQLDCIGMALENNPDILIARFDPELSHYDRQGAYGAFDPTAYANVNLKDEDRETGSALSGAGIVKNESTDWSTGVRGLTPLGTTYDLGVFANRNHTNSSFASLNPAWTTGAGFTLRQPLLKNFGFEYNRRNIEIARRNKQAGMDRFVTTALKTVFSVQQAYLNLLFALRDLEVNQESLKLAEKLLEVNRNKVRVGALAPIEELQAETEVAVQQEGIIVAEKAIDDAEDELKRQIRSETGELADWTMHIYPTDQPVYEPVELNLEEQIGLGMRMRPELRELDKLGSIQDIQIMEKENDLKPSVDLQWKYQFNGLSDEWDRSFRHLESGEYQTYEIGVFAEYPLGTRTARSQLKRTQAERRRTDVQRRSIEQTVTAEVREAVRALATAQRRIEATRKASELARRQLEADQKRFELGLSTSFQVLQFQRDLAQAQRNETKAVIDYMLARLKVLRANGTLLEKMGVYVR